MNALIADHCRCLGRVVKRIERDTSGNVVADSNPALRLPLGFAGGLVDTDTGLIRFGARDYDPDTGRWTAKDPLGLAGGDRDLYRYCLADPVNLVDPPGLNPDGVGEPDHGRGDDGRFTSLGVGGGRGGKEAGQPPIPRSR